MKSVQSGTVSRLANQVQLQLCELLLTQARDSRLSRVRISEVVLSADLSVARVYYCCESLEMSEQQSREIDRTLKKAAGFLRFELAKRLQMRRIAELRFIRDRRLDQAAEIDALLEQQPAPQAGADR